MIYFQDVNDQDTCLMNEFSSIDTCLDKSKMGKSPTIVSKEQKTVNIDIGLNKYKRATRNQNYPSHTQWMQLDCLETLAKSAAANKFFIQTQIVSDVLEEESLMNLLLMI